MAPTNQNTDPKPEEVPPAAEEVAAAPETESQAVPKETEQSLPAEAPQKPEEPTQSKSPEVSESLSDEEKEKLFESKKAHKIKLEIIKDSTILLFVVVILSGLLLAADVNKNNKYFRLFGKSENTATMHKKLKRKNVDIISKVEKADREIRDIKKRLAKEDFFQHRQEINAITSERLPLLDKAKRENREDYGILHSVGNMMAYFNESPEGIDPVIGGGNEIKVERLHIDRERVTFTAQGTNIFGKVFFLNSEFVEMLNSFPFFKDGAIKSFLRKTDNNGDDRMQFTLTIDVQKSTEEDEADGALAQFIQWDRDRSLTDF